MPSKWTRPGEATLGRSECVVTHEADLILDESTAVKVDEDRLEHCPDHHGTVLHIVPSNVAMLTPQPSNIG